MMGTKINIPRASFEFSFGPHEPKSSNFFNNHSSRPAWDGGLVCSVEDSIKAVSFKDDVLEFGFCQKHAITSACNASTTRKVLAPA